MLFKNQTRASVFAVFMLSFMMAFTACKKDEITIEDNTAPPDGTIEDVTINNYINKVYITLLGREPETAEFNSAFSVLRTANVDGASRITFLNQVFAAPDYNSHIYDVARADLLNSLDTGEISMWIQIFTDGLNEPLDSLYWDTYQENIDKLTAMQNIVSDLSNSSINIIDVHKRCVDNLFYDEINMGSENFVVSIFQNFLNRYPTISELDNAVNMVDGDQSIFFLTVGSSKDDFVNIFFSSNSYFEGLVVNLYQRFLYRQPSTVEMSDATQAFYQNNDYKQMQIDILSANEYIGL